MVEFGHFQVRTGSALPGSQGCHGNHLIVYSLQELGLILDRVNGAKDAGLRRTFVFSATLTLPRRSTERKRKKRSMSREESLGEQCERGERRGVTGFV